MHLMWEWRTAEACAKIPEVTKLVTDRHAALQKPDDVLAGRLKRQIEALGWRVIDTQDFSTPPLHTYTLAYGADFQ